MAKRREPSQRGIEKDYPRAPCADDTTLVATRYSDAAIRKWYANYVMLRISGYRLPGPHPTEPTIASSAGVLAPRCATGLSSVLTRNDPTPNAERLANG